MADLPQFQKPELGSLVQAIANAAQAAGGRAFLVGGAVRDGLLGISADDADLEIHHLAPDKLEVLAATFGKVHLVGKQFAVLHVATDHGILELSLPRRESKTGPGHKGFEVSAEPDLGPREASRRRDFTVNSMLQDALTGEVLDPWNGAADLQGGLLRHVSEAFAEDPLRVLRVGRFVSRFGWRVHADTAALCRSLDLAELPLERIEAEWRQILVRGDHPGAALQALLDCGALRHFPEVSAMRDVPQDPVWHPEGDVFHHTRLCLDSAVRIREDMEDPWVEMLAVLAHDFGKAGTTVLERGRWRAPNHDARGAELALQFVARITAENGIAERVAALTADHLRPFQLQQAPKVGDAAIRRLALRVDIPAQIRVSWADAAGRTLPTPPWQEWGPGQWLLERAAALGVRDERPKPFLQGRDLLAAGHEPGPAMGTLIAEAFELQLAGQLVNREAALEWLSAQPPNPT